MQGELPRAAIQRRRALEPVQIEHLLGRLRAGGAKIDPADLAHVWLLQQARIIPNGTYFLGWLQSKTPEMASA